MKRRYTPEQEKEQRQIIIQKKSIQYRAFVLQTLKKFKYPNVLKMEILGITEIGVNEADILYEVSQREGKVKKKIQLMETRNRSGRLMFKIITPEKREIDSSTDFWMFLEDYE